MPSLPFPGVFGKFGQRYSTQLQRNLGPAARLGLGIEQRGTPAITAATRPIPGGVRATAAGVRALPGIKTATGVGTVATVAASQDSRDPITRNIENTLNNVGPNLDRFFGGVTPKEIQDWGREQEKQGLGAVFSASVPFSGGLVGTVVQSIARSLVAPALNFPTSPVQTRTMAQNPRQTLGSLPTGTGRQEGPFGHITSRPKGDVSYTDYPAGVPFSTDQGLVKKDARGLFTAVVPTQFNQTPITSPNTIVERGSASDGISDEYRAQLSAWENKRNAAATALKGFQPGSGPMPAAATEADQAGQALWAKLYPKLAKPGGAVGTYNPLMQARGDVPSMADLWSGMRSIQAPTAGPGRTSEDVTDEAMAKARAEGRYFESLGTMGGFAPAADPATQQRMQQYATAMQAQAGTEEASAAQRSQDFVNKFKLGSLNLGSYNFPGYDANAMMNAPSALFK